MNSKEHYITVHIIITFMFEWWVGIHCMENMTILEVELVAKLEGSVFILH